MSILSDLRRGHFTKLVGSLHPGCHQVPNTTALDRYPEIFTAAAAAAPEAQLILSFGCSTGEECVTLANYFPAAQIVGTDINPLNLLKAMKYRSEQIRFVYASDRILNGFGGFDAVFCMAVLRTWKRRRIARHYPFDRFAERALYLDSLVRPGGLLVIHGATYRFGDTARKCVYETIPLAASHNEVYLPDGATEATPECCIFRKLKPYAPSPMRRQESPTSTQQVTVSWATRKRRRLRIGSGGLVDDIKVDNRSDSAGPNHAGYGLTNSEPQKPQKSSSGATDFPS